MNKPFAIRFGDNDFYNTFMPLVNAISESQFDGTKEELVALINATAYSFYCIFQNYGVVPDESKQKYRTSDYLRVETDRVYYGQDEVDGFFKDPFLSRNTNHDFFYWYPGQEVGCI